MKVNRCHLWRTKHCPEIELQQLWVLDTTLKWMCYYLCFNLKKELQVTAWKVTNTQSLPCLPHPGPASALCPSGPSSEAGTCLGGRVTALAWVPAGPGADAERLKPQSCVLRRPGHCRDAGASVLFTVILARTLPSCGFFPFWFLTFLALHRCSQ